MVRLHKATFDDELQARVIRRTPLFYGDGAKPEDDRPGHVRAGSSLEWFAGRLAIIQDDANFIALFDPAGGGTQALNLPRGDDQGRLFDKSRGNKFLKLDLEASVTVSVDDGVSLLAFGSGSLPAREKIALIHQPAQDGLPSVRLVDASRLYQAFISCNDFSGSELNIEGAVMIDKTLRLFQRGNGAPVGSLVPVNATCDIDFDGFREYLLDAERAPVPLIGNINQYDLGRIGGVELTFTDATRFNDDQILYLASAEDSPDAVRDGAVMGTAIGVIGSEGSARWTNLIGEDGKLMSEKAEGLALDPGRTDRVLISIDPDDPDLPTDLCEVEIRGM